MAIDVQNSSVPVHPLNAVAGSVSSDLTLVNMQPAATEDGILGRTETNTCSSRTTSESAAGSSSVAPLHAVSTINTDPRNGKSLPSGTNNLIKAFLSKQMKVNMATSISVTLAVLAVVYTILSDNIGQKQLDLGMWVFCKSYPGDPQVQNSTSCQMYSQKKSLDELRRRDSTILPETSIQILESVPDWLSVPSRIDRHSCQVVCWNSAPSHTRIAMAPAGISRSYSNIVDSIHFIVFESAIPALRMVMDSSRLSYTRNRDKIRSLVLESAIPQLKTAMGWAKLSYAANTRSIRSLILDSVIPQLRTSICSPRFSYREAMESIRSLILVVDSIRSLIFDPAFPQVAMVLGWPKISYTEVSNSIRSQIFDPTLRKYIIIDIILWLGLKALAPGAILVAQLIYQYGMLLGKVLCRPAIRIIIVAAAV